MFKLNCQDLLPVFATEIQTSTNVFLKSLTLWGEEKQLVQVLALWEAG